MGYAAIFLSVPIGTIFFSPFRPLLTGELMPQSNLTTKARSFGENIESDLASRFLRVVETAAIASARTMGQGERKLSDHVATEAMRRTMDNIPMRGTIVIGEGERDEAPMLYIGERVGAEFSRWRGSARG